MSVKKEANGRRSVQVEAPTWGAMISINASSTGLPRSFNGSRASICARTGRRCNG